MTKTISEAQGRLGDKRVGGRKSEKSDVDPSIKSALLSAAALLKDAMNPSSGVKMHLCIDLKRKLEIIESEHGIALF